MEYVCEGSQFSRWMEVGFVLLFLQLDAIATSASLLFFFSLPPSAVYVACYSRQPTERPALDLVQWCIGIS